MILYNLMLNGSGFDFCSCIITYFLRAKKKSLPFFYALIHIKYKSELYIIVHDK